MNPTAKNGFETLKSSRLLCTVIFVIIFSLFPLSLFGQGPQPGQGSVTISTTSVTGVCDDQNTNAGTMHIVVNGFDSTKAWGCGITDGTVDVVASEYAQSINATNPFVTATSLGNTTSATIFLTARTLGSNTNYTLSASIDQAQFVWYSMATSGATLTGGQDSGQIVLPKYEVISIIYATPGSKSSNGYTTSTTDGTTTSIGSSLQSQDTTTFSVGGGFFGIGTTLSWTFGEGATTGNTTASTSTITQATGVANASGSGFDAIDHHQDLFILWLNPAVKVMQTSDTAGTFSLGTMAQGSSDPNPGQPQSLDQVEVFAAAMLPNAQGVTTVPVAVLKPQVINGQTLPGLANVCANPVFYPNSCTLANQCGCVPSDFAPILALDPLLNFAPTDNPMAADASGVAGCTNPPPSAFCRYVPVMVQNGSSVQVTELLAGPQTAGGNIPVNTFTQTDSTQTAQTLSESLSETTGYSVETTIGLPFGPKFGFRDAHQWTWTNSESTGAINGTANSMTAAFSSSTVGCFQEIPIFEDSVFHTFVFQQPAGNTSCSSPPPPNFSLSITPSSQTVTAGGSTTYTVSTTALNSFTGTVTLAVSGLPSGATGAFNPTSIASTGSSTLTVTTSSATPGGTYTLMITGTSGSLVQTVTATLVVNAPDFSLSVSPASQTITIGGNTTYTVSTSALNGFAGSVALSLTGLPAGVTATFNPTSITGTGSSTLTVTTSSSTPAGTYTLTITGASGALSHSDNVTLIVNSPPDFTISATPVSLTVSRGKSGRYTVTIGSLNGFNGAVTLSVSGVPSKTTASFSSPTVTGSGSVTMTVNVGRQTAVGSYTLTIMGVSGSLTHITPVTLVVN